MAKSALVIHCSQAGRKALSGMARAGLRLPDEIRTMELSCAGGINEVLLMETLEDGIDGVALLGCRKDNCKNINGNLRAEKRVKRVVELLNSAGIKNKAIEMIFTAPDEGRRLHKRLISFFASLDTFKRAKE